MITEIETRSYRAEEIRVDESDGRTTITGMAVPYGALSDDLGGFREQFRAGAFADSLKAAKPIIANVEHRKIDRKLATTAKGGVVFRDTPAGLFVTITPANTSVAKDAIEEIRAGLLDGFSLEFKALEDSYTGRPPAVTREITKAELRGIGLTAYPAYPQTAGTVSVRSLEAYLATCEAETAKNSAGGETRADEAWRAENENLRERLKIEA